MVEIKDYKILPNVLSDQECSDIIQNYDEHMNKLNVTNTYRNMYRTEVTLEDMATLIFSRIQSYIPSEVVISANDVMYGKTYGCEGVWNLSYLNDFFRIAKYHEGGHFSQHRDGIYQKTLSCRSLYTFMIYLNDDYVGGTTNFIDIGDSVRIPKGSAIVFPHNLLHSGSSVISGVKYIMRSDIMYTTSKHFTDDENTAYELFCKATNIEADDPQQAVQLYKKSIKLCPSIQDYF